MAKSKTTGLADKLTEQLRARYEGDNDSHESIETDASVHNTMESNDADDSTKKLGRPSKGKKQKTFYLTNDLIHLLRRHKFEKYMEESTTVCVALEEYFKKEGYIE